jgi:segregation and condensation protein B
MELIKIVEALLFSYQEPLTVEHMTRAVKDTARDIFDMANDEAEADSVALLTKVTEEEVHEALRQLIGHYDSDKHSFTVVERPTGWRLCAKLEFNEWCRALYPGKRTPRLSLPALETLAIIAYRQPITKAGIEAVRGVAVDNMVQQLVDRGLVKIEGRAALPGKPILYGTTTDFLEFFNVSSLEELPNALELRRVQLADPEVNQVKVEPAEQLSLEMDSEPPPAA